METKTKKTRANAGETLVEVMASVFIFLIMMGIMEAAISYSNASLAKNKEIRANNAAVLEQLATASVEDGNTKDITFRAANSDISQLGKQLFTVNKASEEDCDLHGHRWKGTDCDLLSVWNHPHRQRQ